MAQTGRHSKIVGQESMIGQREIEGYVSLYEAKITSEICFTIYMAIVVHLSKKHHVLKKKVRWV